MLFPLALGMPGPFEWLILAFLGLLFFGKRLPEVGKSIGKTIVEFKKGMKEVENEIHDYTPPSPPPTQAQRPALPQNYKFDPQTGKPLKFDPYTGEPINQETADATNKQ